MMGKSGSYFVSKDRETREAQRRAVADSVAANVAATPAGLSQLVLVKRPLELVLPATAAGTVARAADLLFSGNREFVGAHYVSAIDTYSQALRQLAVCSVGDGDGGDGGKLALSVKLTCLLNRAACQLHNENFSACAQDCAAVLTLDPRNVYALVRRALAFERQSQYEDAEDALRLAIELEPDDKDLLAKLAFVVDKAARATEEDAAQEFDWSKYEIASCTARRGGGGGGGGGDLSGASAASAAVDDKDVAVSLEDDNTPACGLAAQLGQLAVVRGPLKRREWTGAAELQAMDPVVLTKLKNEGEDDDDEGDAWMAKAYGEADFSSKDDDAPKDNGGGSDKPKSPAPDEQRGEGGGGGREGRKSVADTDDEAPPGWDNEDTDGRDAERVADPTLCNDDDLDGMPPLENPDL